MTVLSINQHNPRVIEYRQRRVVELSRMGKSLREISRELNISGRAVSRYRRRAKVNKPPNRPFSAEEDAKIRDMLSDGWSFAEIGRTLNRNTHWIGLRYRGQSRYEPLGRHHTRMATELGLMGGDPLC